MIRRCAVSVLAIATAGTLTACSSSGGDKASPSPSPKTSASASKSSTQTVTQPKTVPTKVPNVSGARKQNVITSCTATSDGWAAKGTQKNVGAKDHTFEITIFFTTNPGGTVQSYGSTKVLVKSGATAKWTVSEKFAASKNTLCVLRGVA